MITLDQVLVLQEKVKAAVEKINRLEKENAQLRAQLAASTSNNQSLSQKVSDYEAEQNQIEAKILQVLNSLNTVEDTIRSELSTESLVMTDSIPEGTIPVESQNTLGFESQEPLPSDFSETTTAELTFTDVTTEELDMITSDTVTTPEFDSVPKMDESIVQNNGQLDIF